MTRTPWGQYPSRSTGTHNIELVPEQATGAHPLQVIYMIDFNHEPLS